MHRDASTTSNAGLNSRRAAAKYSPRRKPARAMG